MKNISIFSLLLSLLTLCSCQDLAIEPNVPSVYTSAADNISSTSATLYGYYSSMHVGSSASPLCYFAVSESQLSLENYSYVEYGGDSNSVTTYIGDMSETKYNNSDSWFLELSGLSPNTTYYYFFALVHGNSEVISEISNFTTDNTPPTLKRFSIDMDNCYYSKGYVYYQMTAKMDASLFDYADGNECGVYLRSSDGQYEQFIPTYDNGSTFTVTAAVPKSMYDLYPDTWYSWATTGEMEYGIYVKDQDMYNIFYREVFDGLEYEKQPSITFTDLNQTSDEDYYSEKWDRKAGYKYTVEVSGALFMEQIYESCLGNWSDDVTDYFYEDIYDGSYSSSWTIFYSSSTSSHTNYKEVNAILSDYSILPSDNCIAFYVGSGTCYIDLYYGSDRQNSIARTSVLNTDEKMGVAMTDRLSQY